MNGRLSVLLGLALAGGCLEPHAPLVRSKPDSSTGGTLRDDAGAPARATRDAQSEPGDPEQPAASAVAQPSGMAGDAGGAGQVGDAGTLEAPPAWHAPRELGPFVQTNASTDLRGIELGRRKLPLDALRRRVESRVELVGDTPAGIELGHALLLRGEVGARTSLVQPVRNTSARRRCLHTLSPVAWLDAYGAPIATSEEARLVGSVGLAATGSVHTDCLGPGETGYVVSELVMGSARDPYAETRAVSFELALSPLEFADPPSALVAEHYTLSPWQLAVRLRNAGAAPLSLTGDVTLLLLDELGLPLFVQRAAPVCPGTLRAGERGWALASEPTVYAGQSASLRVIAPHGAATTHPTGPSARCAHELAPHTLSRMEADGRFLFVDAERVYFTAANWTELRTVPLEGGRSSLLRRLPTSYGRLMQAGTQLLWTTEEGIWSAPKAGGEPSLIASGRPDGLAADDSTVYWTEPSGDVVSRPLRGGGRRPLALALTEPSEIALDARFVYVATRKGVVRIDKSSLEQTELLATRPTRLSVHGGDLYYEAEDDLLHRWRAGEDSSETIQVADDTRRPPSSDVTGAYFSSEDRLLRVLPSENYARVIHTNGSVLGQLALDATHVYWVEVTDQRVVRLKKPMP